MTGSPDYISGWTDRAKAEVAALSAIPAPVAAPVPPPTPTPVVAPMKFGTNLEANTPWQNSAPWCDFTHQMTGWYAVGGSTVSYDANGYPSSGHAMSHGWAYNYPAGIWTVRWKGSQQSLFVNGKSTTPPTLAADGYWQMSFPVSEGDFIRLETPSGGITSVQILVPDAVPGQSFRPAFIAALKASGYQMLRLMPWCRVNFGNGEPTPPTTWASRRKPTDYDQTTWGPAYEFMAELSRLTGLPIWVNTAYGADDDYLANMAACFKGLPLVIVEHQNEPWNTGNGFQGNQINADAMKDSRFNLGGRENPAVAGAKLSATLAAHVGSIFRRVLGASNVKVVFGVQAGWDQAARSGLSVLSPGDVDWVGAAPYFQPDQWPGVVTPESVLLQCVKWITGTLTAGMLANAADAAAYGAEFVTYEAGQSLKLTISNPPAVFRQANSADQARLMADPVVVAQNHPLMALCYAMIFALCRRCGVKWFTHFLLSGSWGQSGMWGLKQNPGDPENAKSWAMMLGIQGAI